MSQVVQARCPHCKNVLRIPSAWLTQAMRCKHCQKTFQAKSAADAKSAQMPVAVTKPANLAAAIAPAAPVAALRPAPVAVAIAPAPSYAPPPSDNLFGFDLQEPAEPLPESNFRRRRNKGMLLLVTMMLFLLTLGGAGAGFVIYKAMNTGPGKDANPSAEGADKSGDAKPAVVTIKKKEKQFVSADKVAPPVTDDGPKQVTPPPKKKPRKELKKKITKKDPGVTPKKKFFASDPFPRRALLITVNNYLMFSTVQYGDDQDSVKNGYPGSSTAVLRDRLTRPPMNFPATQVYELSDGVPLYSKTARPHSTQKSVLETTIQDFLDTSRDQDRILIVFAGHGAHIDGASYLVPIDGNMRRPESLLPLKWVYDKLAKCRAQQKVLVLDVFRYSPSRGFELPSPGEGEKGTMPEGFDKDLLNPPPGVQVWSSCVKDQCAVELERGSAFMQALCHALQGSLEMTGISVPTEPLPIESLVGKVNKRLQELVAVEKETQTSRLTGKPSATEIAFNREEPLPPRFDLKPPTAGGAKAAPSAFVSSLLDELSIIPVVRQTRVGDKNLLRADNFSFPADKLMAYKADGYQNLTELEKKYTDNPEAFAKDFPLRAAYFDALDALRKSAKLKMREILASPIDPKRKAAFLLEQDPIGRSIFDLKTALASINDAAEKRKMENSMRWQANFDYIQARLQSRLVYLFEYSYKLGQIRADALPELGPGQTGWRIGTNRKITVTEPEARAYVKDIKKLWKRIQDQYPDTPWDVLAQRESMISLGLSWRPKSD
ncbi:MAG: caspase family protein [Planctomycetes bacterium]|nr:caspase family protein [Planctomycetota bacterium]